jgi:outer membrane lipoprotein-sorting protein
MKKSTNKNCKISSFYKDSILLTIFCSFVVTFSYSMEPKEIIRKMEEKMRGESSYTEMTMETVRPRYTREVSMKSWSLGDDYALILITDPARDKGTSFLKRGNEIWNYVPSIDRTVKMPPSMMSQSWMGSDFSNDDLVRGVSSVDDFTHTLLNEEKIEGLDCYVVEMIPKPDAPVVYEKVVYWVSKQKFLPVKVENYDEFNELVTTIHFKEIIELGGREIPTILEIIPQGKKGQKTILKTHKADYKIDLKENFFSVQNLTTIK